MFLAQILLDAQAEAGPVLVDVVEHSKSFGDIFASTLRQSLFTGFLSLGGLFMAAKSFFIASLRQGIYEQDWYAERVYFARRRTEEVGSAIQPLKDLANRLNTNIVVALSTAILPITLGLLGQTWTAWICILAAVATVLYTIQTVLKLRKLLRIMLEIAEEGVEKKIAKLAEVADAEIESSH